MEIAMISYHRARCYLSMSPKQHVKHWLTLTEQETLLLKECSMYESALIQKIMLKKAYYDGLNRGKYIIPVHFTSPLLEEVKVWWANLHGAYLSAFSTVDFEIRV